MPIGNGRLDFPLSFDVEIIHMNRQRMLAIQPGRVVFSSMAVAMCLSVNAQAADPLPEDEQIIQPAVSRSQITVPKIDAYDFEVTVFQGMLSVENFGTNSVSGLRLAYHVTEDFFLEGTYGKSTISDRAFRDLGLALFPNPEENLTYYNVSLGAELFPGEVFLGRKRAMSSSVYLIGGVGNTDFVGGTRAGGNRARESRFTYNFGIGIRLLPTDWLALRVDVRDHVFKSDLLGDNKTTNNFELTAGIAIFF